MAFIKVTKLSVMMDVYVNPEKITSIYKLEKAGGTMICSGEDVTLAKETPEEIMEMIEEVENPFFNFPAAEKISSEERKWAVDAFTNDLLNQGYARGYQQGREDAFKDALLDDGEYCWQECCATEMCDQCKNLGNGYINYFDNDLCE